MGQAESQTFAALPACRSKRLRRHANGRKYFARGWSDRGPVHQPGRFPDIDIGDRAHSRRTQHEVLPHENKTAGRSDVFRSRRREFLVAGVRMSASMGRAIAVIGGTGPAGTGLALRWARVGETVIIGSRDASRAQQTADAIRQRAGSNAQVSGMENSAACGATDLL